MKIALVQTNPVIGDFSGNVANICSWANKAKAAGCSLIILPEMAVSGYPPQDLLNRPSFINDQERHVQALRHKISGITVLCGLVTRHKANAIGKPLRNSAVLFNDREYHLIHKQLLPTYDIFDERRYFTPGHTSSIISWQGLRLGITICEDIFNFGGTGNRPDDPDILLCGASHGYEIDPVSEFLRDPDERPDMLVNIAASPFSLGKFAARLHFFQKLCRQTALPLIYVNQVGGQDSVLFDGQSLALDAGGCLRARAASFREDMLIIDSETLAGNSANSVIDRLPEEDTSATAFAALVMGTRDYARKCGFKSVVLGLSGGIDSALTAAIASRALGPENVLGVALPSPFTASGSIRDARQLALNLGIGFEVIPIGGLYEAELALLAPLFANLGHDTTEQNIQARIRGNLLMALANKFGRLLLSTGNKSELSVGYCTLYGDMSGGLAVISDVPKLLVYDICRYLNATGEIIPNRTISRPPTAELAPDQRDDDDLPPYDILDPILAAYLEDNKSPAEIVAMGFAKDVVADVIHRLNINEHKRKQAPMGLRISGKAFGSGRRYPTAQGYREDV
ncbi:MAG: NAD+ synthase [Deltaproteobacteria bacterium]|nr:NAD+ synthase [Deltaproteobacteria bacterium]